MSWSHVKVYAFAFFFFLSLSPPPRIPTDRDIKTQRAHSYLSDGLGFKAWFS